MTQREQQYYEFRRFIAMRAKYFFIVLLSNRQYNGKIMFCHPKETLEMSVSQRWHTYQGTVFQTQTKFHMYKFILLFMKVVRYLFELYRFNHAHMRTNLIKIRILLDLYFFSFLAKNVAF
jgi:hypothetical protein